METRITGNRFNPGKYNNYLIAGNITNAFAIGEVGSNDDFFLVGLEPTEESCWPLISGNILDSEGNLLFKLVRNILVFNPGLCDKIIGNQIGYEIHDSAGKLIFKIETRFEHLDLPGDEEYFVTTITANFFNKKGDLVFTANSGNKDEHIAANTKCAFGFSGGFNFIQGYDTEEVKFLNFALQHKLNIFERVTGLIKNQDFYLDGKTLQDATIFKCKVIVKTGDFYLIGKKNVFSDSEFVFEEQALQLFDIFNRITIIPKP